MINVHVVDQRLFTTRAMCNSFIETLEDQPGEKRVIRVNDDWSVHRICSRVRHGNLVGILRIYCHGNASWIQLSDGLSEPGHTRDFQLLRGCWHGRYPRIEIHACAVVSATLVTCHGRTTIPSPDRLPEFCTAGTSGPNTPGRQLVQAIADNAGVIVIAALNVQLPETSGFEGDVVYCRPAQYHLAAHLIGVDMD